MPLDLSHPRTVLPFSSTSSSSASPAGSAQSSTTGSRHGTTVTTGAGASKAPGGVRAIHMKVTEEVLAQLMEMARSGGADRKGGVIKLNLGPSPSLTVSGVAHPLSLNPEPQHSEVVRLQTASRELQPIATITHKASIKPIRSLDQIGQTLRENRALAEKEREGKRAVLLDAAPGSRSSSHNRSASANRAISPAGLPSRTASPHPSSAVLQRQPSRLMAVPAKAPTSSFRIGKGTIPSSIALSRNTSASSLSAPSPPPAAPPAASAAPLPTGLTVASTAGSPPRPAASELAPPSDSTSAHTRNPSRQSSTSSTASSSSSASTLLANPSSATNRTSLSSGASVTSPESLPFVEITPAQGSDKATSAEPKKTARAGGGGMLKGKETLKKEKKQEERAKDKLSAAPSSAKSGTAALKGSKPNSAASNGSAAANKAKRPADTSDSSGDSDARRSGQVKGKGKGKGKVDDKCDGERDAKKRKLGAETESGSGKEARSPAAPASKPLKTITTTVVKKNTAATPSTSREREKARAKEKERGSASETGSKERSKDKAKEREREKLKSGYGEKRRTREEEDSSASLKKKKREVQTERWYSSSDEDEPARPSKPSRPTNSSASRSSTRDSTTATAPKPRASPSAASAPLTNGHTKPHVGSPLRTTISSASLHPPPPASPRPPVTLPSIPPHPPVVVSSATEFTTTKFRFLELYASYASLHSKLAEERYRLEKGEKGSMEADDGRGAFEKLGKMRAELEAVKAGMASWSEGQKTAAGAARK
ncbi:hypothetical protein JCM11641_008108 [Rhodosporidiobolus odoratus]